MILAAIAEVPEILKVVIPEMAPLTTAFPVMPKATLLPTQVELLVVVAAVIVVVPNAPEPPTAPVKVTAPVPAVIVSVLPAALPFRVPPKPILLLVVANVVLVVNTTLPL